MSPNQPKPSPPAQAHHATPIQRHEITFNLAPDIIELLHDFVTTLESPQMTKQELVDLITGATTDITSLLDAEHTEVLAAIEALKSGDVAPEVVSAIQGLVDAVKGGIPKILDVVTAPPAGGGTAGPSNPGGSPAPPAGGGTPVPSTVAP